MSQAFDGYSAYYDLVYKDKDYRTEVDYIDGVLKRFNDSVGKLLEFGSGTGIHGNLLAQKGYDVHGVELSAAMVEQSRVTEGFRCRQGDIRKVRLDKKFDAVVSLFHVMSYQTTNADILAALESAAVHLNPGGLFVFDFWYTPAVYGQKPEVRVKRMENDAIKVTRVAEPKMFPNDNRVDVHYTIYVDDKKSGAHHVLEEIHPMRHFSLPEIGLMAQMVGFELLNSEAFLSGKTPGEDTWGVCVVLGKL